MKKIKILLLAVISAVLILSGCDADMDSTITQLKRQNKESKSYLEAVNQITNEFMSANFMIEVTFYKDGSHNTGQGSAVIFKKENSLRGSKYYLLTNQHVTGLMSSVVFGASVSVVDYQNNRIAAQVEYENNSYDLAIVSFVSDNTYYVPEFAEDNPAIGVGVFAVGQPNGQRNAVTFGYVKYYQKQTFDWANISFPCLFHSAYIQQGNSGGVLLDKNLKIVGINFAAGIYAQGEEAQEALEELGMETQISISVPVLRVKDFLSLHFVSMAS